MIHRRHVEEPVRSCRSVNAARDRPASGGYGGVGALRGCNFVRSLATAGCTQRLAPSAGLAHAWRASPTDPRLAMQDLHGLRERICASVAGTGVPRTLPPGHLK